MVYDFKAVEESILKFWKKNRIREQLKKRNLRGPKFFHLDGPPYATGNPHPGTAINRGLKDLVRRYKRMKGFNVWDQPGFDMHGLPIESMVEKKLGLKNKQEIINYGVRKFVSECKKYAFQYVGVMGDVFSRLGEWADWEHPYETTNNDYIDGVWMALKKIWERGALYEGSKVLPWCPHCGTALAANYEIVHKEIEDKSIYVKFKVKDAPSTYLIIWTTTPWTLSSNMAVMANPEVDYSFVDVGKEEWVIAKELVGKVMNLAGINDYKVKRVAKGKELLGIHYIHPFLEEVPYHQEDHGRNAYSVVLSKKYVNLTDGTGLVHCAPGCGPEDQEVGNEYSIPSFNPVDENGIFSEQGGKLKGLRAKFDDNEFIDLVSEKGLLVAMEKVRHEYPHCERCKSPVIFRNTKQWFIRVTSYRDKMLSENRKVNWVPAWAGKRQFASWLKGIKDWCITRQRFWGIPLPVWVCDKCGKVEVIGGVKELSKYAEVPKDLHKPFIDKVVWKCKCGGTFKRNPDVIDVWIDSACAPFASLPQPRDKWLSKLGKIDFITESKDQIRGWFYSLMGIGVTAFDECPYTNIVMHAFITDENGRKLSKRLGNYMSMPEIFEKYGADVFRTSLMSNFTPGVDLRFIPDDLASAYRMLNVVWNTHEFIKRNMDYFNVRPSRPSPVHPEDSWLLSRLNSTRKVCEEAMRTYHLEDYAPAVLGFLVDDLSRFYIKLVRGKLDANVINLIRYAYLEGIKLLGPLAPFISEKVYKNLGGKELSLFFEKIPSPDSSLINARMEKEMNTVRELMTSVLAAREKAGINVRWPLSEVIVNKRIPAKFKELFLDYVNAKKVTYSKVPEGIKVSFKPDFKAIREDFDEKTAGKIIPKLMTMSREMISRHLLEKGSLVIDVNGEQVILSINDFIREEALPENLTGNSGVYINNKLTPDLLSEGYARELVRRIQEGRKKLGLRKVQRIEVSVDAPDKFAEMIKPHLSMIKEVTGSKQVDFSGRGKYDFSSTHQIRDYKVSVKLKKL